MCIFMLEYRAYLMTKENNPTMTGEVLAVEMSSMADINNAIRTIKNNLKGTDRMICYTEIKEI